MPARDAHFEILMDLKSGQSRIEERLISIENKANLGVNANERLTKHENRIIGWVLGIGGASAAGGVALSDTIKNLIRM